MEAVLHIEGKCMKQNNDRMAKLFKTVHRHTKVLWFIHKILELLLGATLKYNQLEFLEVYTDDWLHVVL